LVVRDVGVALIAPGGGIIEGEGDGVLGFNVVLHHVALK
jgi:hypothetical protein